MTLCWLRGHVVLMWLEDYIALQAPYGEQVVRLKVGLCRRCLRPQVKSELVEYDITRRV